MCQVWDLETETKNSPSIVFFVSHGKPPDRGVYTRGQSWRAQTVSYARCASVFPRNRSKTEGPDLKKRGAAGTPRPISPGLYVCVRTSMKTEQIQNPRTLLRAPLDRPSPPSLHKYACGPYETGQKNNKQTKKKTKTNTNTKSTDLVESAAGHLHRFPFPQRIRLCVLKPRGGSGDRPADISGVFEGQRGRR